MTLEDQSRSLLKEDKVSKSATLNPLKEGSESYKTVTLWRSPFTTVYYFSWQLYLEALALFDLIMEHKVTMASILSVFLFCVMVLNIDGPQQQYLLPVHAKCLWCLWWVGLGILSSVGLGTGLHTFLLYLGPHIANVTIAAWECSSVNFPEPPYPNKIVCPENAPKVAMSIWLIVQKVQLESFMWQKDLIEDGDTVIVRRETTLEPLVMKAGAQHQLTCGLYRHSDVIGQPYGCKIYSHNKKGHATFLYPTPELWTLALPHRTQILYHADISLICIQLELAPGMRVVESGTGSGSLTHALARSVGPTGRVDTCEFHKERAETAGKEFESHGISHIVTAHHRDVIMNGFPTTDADAVFLDLPSPWDAIKHTVSTFGEGGGRLCSFSPCVEQVQKCCLALQEHGFEEIQTMEVIQRPYQLSRKKLWEPFIGKTRHKKFREEQRASDKTFEKGWVHAFVKGGPKKQAVGHTGYLTFATLPAKVEEEQT